MCQEMMEQREILAQAGAGVLTSAQKGKWSRILCFYLREIVSKNKG